jgi:hypothetical protein
VAELDDTGRGAADDLLARVGRIARDEATREVNKRLANLVAGGRLNWDMLTQWGHRISDNGTPVPIRPNLDLVGFTVADVPVGDLTRVSAGGGDFHHKFSEFTETTEVGSSAFAGIISIPQTHRNFILIARGRETQIYAPSDNLLFGFVYGSDISHGSYFDGDDLIYDWSRLHVDPEAGTVAVESDQGAGFIRFGSDTSNQAAGGSPSPYYDTGGDGRMATLYVRIFDYTDSTRFKNFEWRLVRPKGPANTGGKYIEFWVGFGQIELLDAITGFSVGMTTARARHSWAVTYGEDPLP